MGKSIQIAGNLEGWRSAAGLDPVLDKVACDWLCLNRQLGCQLKKKGTREP